MKRCTKCNIDKPITDFSVRSSRPSGRSSHCKVCHNIQTKEWRSKNKQKIRDYKLYYHHNVEKDGIFRVYTLPNANYYVGQTACIKKRMREHITMSNNDTTDYIILHECKTRKEALWYESVYHNLGFPGKHKKTPTKR